MSQQLDGIRKSAILLLSLDETQRELILSHLPEDAADLVAQEMARLDDVPPAERQAVLSESCRELNAPDAPNPPAFTAAQLYDALRDEHPQCISAVLSCLTADTSAGCLAKFPVSIQVEIIRRLSHQASCAPGVLEEIRNVLADRVAAMRGSASGSVESDLLARVLDETLDEHPVDLTASPFRIEDILRLDDANARLVLLEIEPQDVLLALNTANRKLRAKILRNLPNGQRRSLVSNSKRPAPSYLQEVESAHSRIAQVLHRLEASGDIAIAQTRRRR